MPNLKGRSRAGLLIQLYTLHRSEPLEITQEASSVESELPQRPITFLTNKQKAEKEKKETEESTDTGPELTKCELDMDYVECGGESVLVS